jgi:hypothetical protein
MQSASTQYIALSRDRHKFRNGNNMPKENSGLAHALPTSPEIDRELARIVEAWQRLSHNRKRQMIAIIEASLTDGQEH